MRKSLIIGFTLLLLMLFAATAFSVEGPSRKVVFPFICQIPKTSFPPNENLDMVFTIANTTPIDTDVHAFVRSFSSELLFDFQTHLTPFDVSRNTCSSVINSMPAASRSAMITTIGQTGLIGPSTPEYYVGYIEYDVEFAFGSAEPHAFLIGWGEIETLKVFGFGLGGPNGKITQQVDLFTDAGFNGVPDFYDAINAASSPTEVNGVWGIDSNQILMPRYNITNGDPATHNWWIIMTPSDEPLSGPCNRALWGNICDENENCVGPFQIPIPYQVNVINVAALASLSNLFPAKTFPKSGFGSFDVILSSTAGADSCGSAGNEQYLGWSYQYTMGNSNLRTALIIPIHRRIGQAAGN